jgi:hypothetical protein
VIHGKEGECGFEGERELRVTQRGNGEEDWTVRYHLTDPVKITTAEKLELVEKMVHLVEEVKETVGEGTRALTLDNCSTICENLLQESHD